MKDLVATLAAWRAEGVEVGRAVVVRTFGSAPRQAGAVLLAAADGRIAGSVSGGCVEGAVAEAIARARASGRSMVVRYGISDEVAWGVGLACGGTIDVLVEPLVRPEVEAAARATAGDVRGPATETPITAPTEAASQARTAGPAPSGGARAIITPLPADAPGPALGPHTGGRGEPPAPILVAWEDGRLDGTLGDPLLDAELVREAREALARGASLTIDLGGRALFIESFPQRPRLVMVGAVQTAIPLATIARVLGYETIVVDGRPAFATRERFPDVDRLIVGWLDEVADAIALGPPDAVAVLSHDVKFDDPAIVTALARGCRYVGAIGSRKSQAERRERLRAAGVGEADLARLRGPIGLDLGGHSPAETALAIMAEIVVARYGGTGRPLRERLAQAAPVTA